MKTRTFMDWLRRAAVRDAFAALALATYYLTALIPAGYMPAGDGVSILKLCTATGLTTRTPAAGDEGDGTQASDGTCAFALLPASATPPAIDTVPRVHVASSGTLTLRTVSRDATSGPLRAQSARAPPLNS